MENYCLTYAQKPIKIYIKIKHNIKDQEVDMAAIMLKIDIINYLELLDVL